MSNIKVTQQQRDNLLDALHVMWPSVPEANVIPHLIEWRNADVEDRTLTPSCGTVACFGGWCAHWPAYKSQGVKAGPSGAPYLGQNWELSAAKYLFGDVTIFIVRGRHVADADFTGSDHALVTNRLQWLLDNSEVAE